MKLFALAAVASAGTTEWVLEHWWGNANKVYDYIAANHGQYMSLLASEGNKFDPLWNFCGGADGSLNAGDLTNCGKRIGDYVGMSGSKL